jgi:hypothetical protein
METVISADFRLAKSTELLKMVSWLLELTVTSQTKLQTKHSNLSSIKSKRQKAKILIYRLLGIPSLVRKFLQIIWHRSPLH